MLRILSQLLFNIHIHINSAIRDTGTVIEFVGESRCSIVGMHDRGGAVAARRVAGFVNAHQAHLARRSSRKALSLCGAC